FETRWALSYLAGPLTRSQIKTLTDPVRTQFMAAGGSGGNHQTPVVTTRATAAPKAVANRPVVPPEVPQYFIPARRNATSGQSMVYLPMIYGVGEVLISDSKSGIDTTMTVRALCAITNDPICVNWDNAKDCDVDAGDLEKDPSETSAAFGELPSVAAKAKSFEGWSKDFANWMYRSQSLTLYKSPSSG